MANECSEQMHKNNVIKVHFFYITFLLVAVIVLLATSDWTKLDGFTEYLNVAATVSSLLLAILAIIYSFVTSGAQSQFLGAIQSSASEISSISSELKTVVAEGQGLQNRAEQRTDELQDLVVDLRTVLSDVSDKTTAIAGAVKALPERFGAFQTAPREEEATDISDPRTKREWTKQELSGFMKITSIAGLVMLRGAMLAYEKDKFIKISKLNGVNDLEYIFGFLMASSAAGICKMAFPETGPRLNFKSFKESGGMLRLKDPSADLLDAIQSEWMRREKILGELGKSVNDKYEPLFDLAMI